MSELPRYLVRWPSDAAAASSRSTSAVSSREKGPFREMRAILDDAKARRGYATTALKRAAADG